LTTRPCVSNGLAADDQKFELLADWQLRHIPTGLCAQYMSDTQGVTLEQCEFGAATQQFRNDYTRIRNAVVPVTLSNLPGGDRVLAGFFNGTVVTPKVLGALGTDYAAWSYFPNTFQLRNQYTGVNDSLGYPLCLSACGTSA